MAGKSARRDRPLPPMTCLMKTSRIASRAGTGSSRPISGSTLAVAVTGTPAAARAAATSSRASTFPASTTGTVRRRAAMTPALCLKISALPPSVPPTSSTTSGRAASSASQVVVAHRAGRDVHDAGPGRQTHPVAGLGRHDPFVADDREPEPAAGTGAGQRRRCPGAQLGPDRVHAVHDVGAESGGVGGGAEQRTVGEVDERGLGERGPDVDADHLAAAGHPAAGRHVRRARG